MPEPKFTPGPWTVYDENEGEAPAPPFWCIANDAFHNGGEDDPAFQAGVLYGSKADAHIIAAAPDLYAALEINLVALAQAHGVMSAVRPSLHLNYVDVCDCHTGQAYRATVAVLAKARGESGPT